MSSTTVNGSTPQKASKRPVKRVLVRWDADKDQQLLLNLNWALSDAGMKAPWGRVVALMGPMYTEGAIIQHLAKLRQQMAEAHLQVPPTLPRGKIAKTESTVYALAASKKRKLPPPMPLTPVKSKLESMRVQTSGRLARTKIKGTAKKQNMSDSDDETSFDESDLQHDDTDDEYGVRKRTRRGTVAPNKYKKPIDDTAATQMDSSSPATAAVSGRQVKKEQPKLGDGARSSTRTRGVVVDYSKLDRGVDEDIDSNDKGADEDMDENESSIEEEIEKEAPEEANRKVDDDAKEDHDIYVKYQDTENSLSSEEEERSQTVIPEEHASPRTRTQDYVTNQSHYAQPVMADPWGHTPVNGSNALNIAGNSSFGLPTSTSYLHAGSPMGYAVPNAYGYGEQTSSFESTRNNSFASTAAATHQLIPPIPNTSYTSTMSSNQAPYSENFQFNNMDFMAGAEYNQPASPAANNRVRGQGGVGATQQHGQDDDRILSTKELLTWPAEWGFPPTG